MTPLAIVTLTLAWGPLRDVRDLDARAAIAAAIVSVTDDEHEQGLLARLAWTEARYSMRVARCAPGTTAGGRGVWQVVPRVAAGYRASCGTLEEQAGLALERVRESLRACRHLPEAERLSVYAAGSCASARGRRLSRDRWVRVDADGEDE